MKKNRFIVRGIASVISMSFLVYQMGPILHGLPAIPAAVAGAAAKKQPVVLREGQRRPVSGAAVTESSRPTQSRIALASSATSSAVDAEHTIVNKKGTAQYLVKTDTKRAYHTINRDYEEQVTEESLENSVLEKEKILVANLTEQEAKEIGEQNGIQIEKDALLDGAATGMQTAEKRLRNQGAASGTIQQNRESTVQKKEKDNSRAEKLKEALQQMAHDEWNVHAVHAEQEEEGQDIIRVAVLDSGRDIYGDYSIEKAVDLVNPDSEGFAGDTTGHGTAVQTILAGRGTEENGIRGVAAESEYIRMSSVKVLDENNQAPVSRIIEGIEWCIQNDIQIINMSFGMSNYSAILEATIEKAEEAGILMVASVGNNGETDNPEVQYPAGYEEVIGVGSLNQEMERSSFSACGTGVELMAPGEYVPTSYFLRECSVGSGTSYAAPHVTAVAAMLWSFDTDRSNREIRRLLQKSARELGAAEEYGYGLVDYTYACSIRDSLQEEQEPEEEDEAEKNVSEVLGYEVPEVVTAQWSKDLHRVEMAFDTSSAYCAERADVEFRVSDDARYAVLHGTSGTNFVAGARYLYMVAKSIREEKDMQSIIAKRNNGYAAYEQYTLGLTDDDLYALNKAITYAETEGFNGSITAIANQVMGFAMHIAGDTYAHSVLVPSYASLKNRAESLHPNAKMSYYFAADKLDELKSKLPGGYLATRELKKYAKNDEAKEDIREDFIDNTEYLPKRYSVAALWATRRMRALYENNLDFDAYVFCPNFSVTDAGQYKLQRLSYFVAITFEKGIDSLEPELKVNNKPPKDDNEIIVGVTAEVWQQLSYIGK